MSNYGHCTMVISLLREECQGGKTEAGKNKADWVDGAPIFKQLRAPSSTDPCFFGQVGDDRPPIYISHPLRHLPT
jgi:hypothetical protein